MKARHFLAPLALLAVAACGAADIRYGAPAPVPGERIGASYSRVELAEVDLPVYAETEEIQVLGAGGAITAAGGLWSDAPSRAVTLQLARDLGALTGGIVAPEPWPFRDFPQARVDVRVEQFLATEAGTFRLSGQVFVAPEGPGRDRAERFDIVTPVAEPGGPSAIAAAQGAAVTVLARQVAALLR